MPVHARATASPVVSAPRAGGTLIVMKNADANWRSRAACLSADPELFFPLSEAGTSVAQEKRAKAMCSRCPVRSECLDFALATREVHGVWGGTSEDERRRLLARRLAKPRGVPAVAGRSR